MRKKFLKLLLLYNAILVTLLISEAVLRIFYKPTFSPHWAVESRIHRLDNDLIFSLQPNGYDEGEEGPSTIIHQINSFGLRDREISLKKGDTFRVIALGDSFTYGHGVNVEESYPKILEKLLQRRYNNIEVINAGIQGFGMDQQYKFFKKRLVHLKPDLLLWQVEVGDIWDAGRLSLYDIKDKGSFVDLKATDHWIYSQGAFFLKTPKFLRSFYFFDFALKAIRVGKGITRADKEFLRKDIDLWEKNKIDEWAKKKMLKEFLDVAETGRKEGFKLIVVFFPDGSLLWDEDRYAWEAAFFKQIAKELEGNNIEFLDTHQAFFRKDVRKINEVNFDNNEQKVLGVETVDLKKLFLTNNYHLSARGIQSVSEFIFERIMPSVRSHY